MREALTLAELNGRVAAHINAAADLSDVWIKAETSDVRVSGGHCYMELLQKSQNGVALAKARAVIWSSVYARLAAVFGMATGSRLASDMKVMVRASVSYHPVYGLSLVITDIDPDYTAGDLVRRRNEIIVRLKAEGVFDLNRTLPWNSLVWRVAVVSSDGAAGYGDFMHQLHSNPHSLRFTTELFPAVLQGERTPASVIAALERIMDRIDCFDCVVIIRGGGAVSDLASYDDYDLAAAVAQFPLPVIVGIGHDRDVTVLDYVAAQRVKTPTAAAGLLVDYQWNVLCRLMSLGNDILKASTDVIRGEQRRLAYIEGTLPALAQNVVVRARSRVGQAVEDAVAAAARNVLIAAGRRLDAVGELLSALSPEATLRRGFSITRVAGHALYRAADLRSGDEITTLLASGDEIRSVIK